MQPQMIQAFYRKSAPRQDVFSDQKLMLADLKPCHNHPLRTPERVQKVRRRQNLLTK